MSEPPHRGTKRPLEPSTSSDTQGPPKALDAGDDDDPHIQKEKAKQAAEDERVDQYIYALERHALGPDAHLTYTTALIPLVQRAFVQVEAMPEGKAKAVALNCLHRTLVLPEMVREEMTYAQRLPTLADALFLVNIPDITIRELQVCLELMHMAPGELYRHLKRNLGMTSSIYTQLKCEDTDCLRLSEHTGFCGHDHTREYLRLATMGVVDLSLAGTFPISKCVDFKMNGAVLHMWDVPGRSTYCHTIAPFTAAVDSVLRQALPISSNVTTEKKKKSHLDDRGRERTRTLVTKKFVYPLVNHVIDYAVHSFVPLILRPTGVGEYCRKCVARHLKGEYNVAQ